MHADGMLVVPEFVLSVARWPPNLRVPTQIICSSSHPGPHCSHTCAAVFQPVHQRHISSRCSEVCMNAVHWVCTGREEACWCLSQLSPNRNRFPK